MTIWQFLHIVSMFGAVSLFVGQGLLSAGIARTGDVRTIRRTLAVEARFGPVGGGLFLLGIVFGFVTALTGGFDLTAPWLLTAYVLAAVILATGSRITDPAEGSSKRSPRRAQRMSPRRPFRR